MNQKQKYVYAVMRKNKKTLSSIGSYFEKDIKNIKQMIKKDIKLKFKINETVTKFYMSKDKIKQKNKYRHAALPKEKSVNIDHNHHEPVHKSERSSSKSHITWKNKHK